LVASVLAVWRSGTADDDSLRVVVAGATVVEMLVSSATALSVAGAARAVPKSSSPGRTSLEANMMVDGYSDGSAAPCK
jgi:hypothetical protein